MTRNQLIGFTIFRNLDPFGWNRNTACTIAFQNKRFIGFAFTNIRINFHKLEE